MLFLQRPWLLVLPCGLTVGTLSNLHRKSNIILLASSNASRGIGRSARLEVKKYYQQPGWSIRDGRDCHCTGESDIVEKLKDGDIQLFCTALVPKEIWRIFVLAGTLVGCLKSVPRLSNSTWFLWARGVWCPSCIASLYSCTSALNWRYLTTRLHTGKSPVLDSQRWIPRTRSDYRIRSCLIATLTSPLNYASERSKYFGRQRNISPLCRVDPNPFFDVFDVVDPYGKRRSSTPRTVLKKAHLQL